MLARAAPRRPLPFSFKKHRSVARFILCKFDLSPSPSVLIRSDWRLRTTLSPRARVTSRVSLADPRMPALDPDRYCPVRGDAGFLLYRSTTICASAPQPSRPGVGSCRLCPPRCAGPRPRRNRNATTAWRRAPPAARSRSPRRAESCRLSFMSWSATHDLRNSKCTSRVTGPPRTRDAHLPGDAAEAGLRHSRSP